MLTKSAPEKQTIVSLGPKDFRVEYYRGSGAGGQKRNKTSSACRVTHIASGATGQSQDQRSQSQNRKLAFTRMAASEIFQKWLRVEVAARLQGFEGIEKKVDEMMKPENLRIEYFKEEGRSDAD